MKYLTITEPCEYKFDIMRSDFVVRLCHVENVAEVKSKVAEIEANNPCSASNCFAYILSEKTVQQGPEDAVLDTTMVCCDDKEEEGTAGEPMLAMLTKARLFEVLAVVSRYFGTVRISGAGLSQAYARAVAEAVSRAVTDGKIGARVLCRTCEFTLEYAEYKNFTAPSTLKYKVLDVDYGEKVSIKVAVPVEHLEVFSTIIRAITSGRVMILIGKPEFIVYQ